jgi:hypothetical protein
MTHPLSPFDLSAGIETAIGAVSQPKARTMPVKSQTSRICDLNDAFRTTLAGGQCVTTPGLCELGDAFVADAIAAARAFSDFTPDNDPDGEHDFGAFRIGEQRLVWKIDYYDSTMRFGSRDPSDPAQTKRVLTVMLADEY